MEVPMGTTTFTESTVAVRVLNEGYGPGAWHGPDLKAALAAVTPALAFWRPAPDRHNIAEIALHHAYCTRNARAQMSGATADPFVLAGDDWFDLPDETRLAWPAIQAAVESEQEKLAASIAEIEAEMTRSPLGVEERFNLALGITCHAIYHAGQVQLIKRLHTEE
jgi:hypothetical protein